MLHKKTGDHFLCPVLQLGTAVQRVRKFIVGTNDSTLLCTFKCMTKRKVCITQTYIRELLRKTYKQYMGAAKFGFAPHDIGTKSLRSGAAIALFLNNHSSDKIMILRRWKSKSFLNYIRPQVVEWTELFSGDMIAFEYFFELFARKSRSTSERETPAKPSENHYEIPELCTEF